MKQLIPEPSSAPGIDSSVCEHDAKPTIDAFLTLFETTSPSLRQIWAAMDFAWDQIGIDNRNPDPVKLSEFYSHPIWLLNGLFIEQHEQSLKNRDAFAAWVESVAPGRVADFGGGYGTLARAIALRCPQSQVEVVEPYPRPEALRQSNGHENLAFPATLEGEYDVIIATDVFEHVTDPVGLTHEVGSHLPIGGRFLIANHFAPSIKCHLPSTFHFNLSWGRVMKKLGFEKEERVSYGTVYRRTSVPGGLSEARKVEQLSQRFHRIPKVCGSGRAKRLLWRATPV
jgi:SAM-dependent methyltransferase